MINWTVEKSVYFFSHFTWALKILFKWPISTYWIPYDCMNDFNHSTTLWTCWMGFVAIFCAFHQVCCLFYASTRLLYVHGLIFLSEHKKKSQKRASYKYTKKYMRKNVTKSNHGWCCKEIEKKSIENASNTHKLFRPGKNEDKTHVHTFYILNAKRFCFFLIDWNETE